MAQPFLAHPLYCTSLGTFLFFGPFSSGQEFLHKVCSDIGLDVNALDVASERAPATPAPKREVGEEQGGEKGSCMEEW